METCKTTEMGVGNHAAGRDKNSQQSIRSRTRILRTDPVSFSLAPIWQVTAALVLAAFVALLGVGSENIKDNVLINFFSSLFHQSKLNKENWNFRESLGSEWNLPRVLSSSESLTLLQNELGRLTAISQGLGGSGADFSPKSFGTRIVNSFVHNQTLLKHLAQETLWRECYEKPVRWIPLTIASQQSVEDLSPSRGEELPRPARALSNIWEELAYSIWKDQPELTSKIIKGSAPVPASGLEYWCNILTPETPLQWHVDKDEELYMESNNEVLRTPTMGAVYYGYPHIVQGGYLELLSFGAVENDDHSMHSVPEDAGREIERIRPEYNRLVFLNVSMWHAVSPLWSGSRFTLAVNLWHGPAPLAFREDKNE